METKVVKILSNTTLVLGAGTEGEVREGMEFVIYEPGEEVLDPETNEILGRLEIVKGYVTVVNVQPKLCIAKTQSHTVTRTRTVRKPTIFEAFSGSREEQYEVEGIERLKVAEVDNSYEEKLVVKVGDKARLTQQ